MPSEGDYPYEIFLWDVQAKGEFSLEGLLRKRSELAKVELDYFWQTLPSDNLSLKQKFINAYQTLLESLQPHITGLEVYELKTSRFVEKYSKATVYMILAETITGDYLGISICLDFTEIQDLNALPCFEIRDFALTKSENIELVVAIESALDKANSLLPKMNEVSEFIWQIGEKRDSVFQNLAVATKHFTIQEYIYKKNEDEDNDERDSFSFSFCFSKSTYELINTNLTNLRYYFVGAVRIDIYLVGEGNNGDFIGIHTKVVWT
ncbi:MAG: nuclease A inhibitor family protein [Scytonematopsis contorta HA4267-MV1]|jgi:hypothetical protein|nr:nuclease A inhibitor family protein [Scytonematopsis contorta HA4267-MV1]